MILHLYVINMLQSELLLLAACHKVVTTIDNVHM